MSRLDRLDQKFGLVKPDQVRLSQRELWRAVIAPPLRWWFLAAVAVTVAAGMWMSVLVVGVGPAAVGAVIWAGARRARQNKARTT